jgi:MATE family multidrug resistance protein
VHLAAVAIGASLVTFVFWSCGFLRMGTTSLTAHAHGAGDQRSLVAVFWQSCQVALGLSVVILLGQLMLLEFAVALLVDEAHLQAHASAYVEIRLYAAPVVLLNYVIAGWFIGRQDTRTPLILALLLNLANIGLDIWLVWGLGLGSVGAAWASSIAELLTFIVGAVLVARAVGGVSLRELWRRHPWPAYQRLLVMNSQLFVRTFLLLAVLLFFASQGARLGTTVLAANAVLLQLVNIISYSLDAFAHSAQALVGKAVGQKNPEGFRLAFRNTGYCALGSALLMSLVLWLLGSNTVHLFSDIESVRIAAADFYGYIVLFPLLSIAAYQFDGVFIGWGKTGVMMCAMVFCVFAVFVPIWWLVGGNHGLWLALTGLNIARGLSLGGYYLYSNSQGNGRQSI